ncbi:hypothetical protein JCM3766R1_000605 [Sporobolomyces carnicolor]
MCNAEATLVYGLTVRAVDLLFAARAWTRLEPTFRFFDLVFLRRRNGSLITRSERSGGVRAISRIPDEVWEEIRYQLVQEEIAISQNTAARKKLCTELPENLYSWSYLELGMWMPERVTHIAGFVKAFGLALPMSQPLKIEPNRDDQTTALALLAAPSNFRQSLKDTAVIRAECGEERTTNECTIVDISLDGLPLDIDSRFRRFIELFNLEVVGSAVDAMSPVSNQGGAKRARETTRGSDRSTPHGLKDRVTTEIKPRWRLCVLGEAI